MLGESGRKLYQAFDFMTPSILFDDPYASKFLLQPASNFSLSLWPC